MNSDANREKKVGIELKDEPLLKLLNEKSIKLKDISVLYFAMLFCLDIKKCRFV